MAEIELKFVSRQLTLDDFLEKVVPALKQLGMDVSPPQRMQLQNDYYDTQAHDFQQHKIGFRVRGNDGVFEQTLKTRGEVRGGLHERAEYDIPLSEATPDLTLFDKEVWPEGLEAEKLNGKLEHQFSTHFTRTALNVIHKGSTIEIVLDEGEAFTGKERSSINEIELEMKEGEVPPLFDIADIINSILPVRVSDVSKAAQGYQLLNGVSNNITPLPEFLALPSDASTEAAFMAAAQQALTHWQTHEHLFLQTNSSKMLNEVAISIRLLLQAVSLYLPVLQCRQMLDLHKQLMNYMPEWAWQEDLRSLRQVVSKKSLFNKCLSRYSSLQSYLHGRKAGLVHAYDPATLMHTTESTAIKLSVIRLLTEKPWQNESTTYQMPVTEHARGWLSQSWQTVQQSMSPTQAMAAANYLAVEVVLRQTLWNGFLLADLFSGERHAFRAPWLDILTGIDELKALEMLKTLISDTDPEDKRKITQWANEKEANLLTVMERTRKVGMQGDIYW
ncbi:CYTH domain-containing protein [Salinimonas chungwhensis]|uniref:CYTH domain-containing protein n=1 Tax=Salinimonas chungwhensis TaxID=265425 RepID=UPI00036AA783|nr:CYTH domain-containing protein [Salinimonas chungwhensis]